MRSSTRPTEIFLSHASRDRAFASRLAEVLRGSGLPVWYSVTHLAGAQQWHREIGAALRRLDWFIVVLSPASVKSMWVERELTFALSERRYRGRIVPILLKPCRYDRLSWTLGSIQFVDFTKGREAGLAALGRAWKLKLSDWPLS